MARPTDCRREPPGAGRNCSEVLQQAAWQPENLLALAIMLPSAARSPRLWLLFAAYICTAGLPWANPALSLRSAGPDGLFFAVAVGPALAVCYGEAAGWLCDGKLEAMMMLGSLQALLDLKLTWRPWAHVAQVLAFAACTSALEGVPLLWAVLFAGAQKIALGCCLSQHLWGRCFSAIEGLFWAQTVAVICVSFLHGYLASFSGWRLVSIFSVVLVIFTLLFFALTALAHALFSRADVVSVHWSPVDAGLTTLAMFAVWMLTGIGGWAANSPDRTPLVWLRDFVLAPRHARFLLWQWPSILVVGVGSIHLIAVRSAASCGTGIATRRKVLHRKAFHALAVALFMPPILAGEGEFLGFCLMVAALLFIVLETCRVCRVPGLAPTLDSFVGRYLDKREDTRRGDLVLTHLYLLLGCAIPVWLESTAQASRGFPGAEARPWDSLRLSSGVLLVGVGDAFAAACGVSFGRIRWPLSHRTLEGSTAFAVSILLAACSTWALAPRHASGAEGPVPELRQLLAYAGATVLSMLLEVYTHSIDNLVLPLYFCPLLRALGG